MKKLTLLLSLLLSLTIFAQNSETKDKNEIMKVLNMQQEAWSNTDIEGFEKSKPSISEYIESKKGYKKNVHTITREKLERILKEWDFAMKEWNYNVPDNVKIIK